LKELGKEKYEETIESTEKEAVKTEKGTFVLGHKTMRTTIVSERGQKKDQSKKKNLFRKRKQPKKQRDGGNRRHGRAIGNFSVESLRG